jgi:hypothetical protein
MGAPILPPAAKRSATARKLGYQPAVSPKKAVNVFSSDVNLIVNVGQLEKLFQSVCCSECGGNMNVEAHKFRGMCAMMKLLCDDCGKACKEQTTPDVPGTNIPEVHRRVVCDHEEEEPDQSC